MGSLNRLSSDERSQTKDLGSGFHHVSLGYGFMEGIDAP